MSNRPESFRPEGQPTPEGQPHKPPLTLAGSRAREEEKTRAANEARAAQPKPPSFIQRVRGVINKFSFLKGK